MNDPPNGELEMLECFWSGESSGEPTQWSTEKLLCWLEAADGGFTSGLGWRFDRGGSLSASSASSDRAALLRLVTSRLDSLYSSFQPRYQTPIRGVRIDRLPPWEPAVDPRSLPATMPIGGRTAGPLEQRFNSSYAMHEATHCIGRALPAGRHPLDDLRQDMLVIVRESDEGRAAVVAQDDAQTELCMMSVRDVRLLLPGGRLKPGARVVALRPFLPPPPMSGSPGSTGEAAADDTMLEHLPGLVGMVAEISGGKATVSFPSGMTPVDVHQLLLLKEQQPEGSNQEAAAGTSEPPARPLPLGAWVALQGLVARPELNGRLGVVTADIAASGTQEAETETARCTVSLADWSRALGGPPLPAASAATVIRVQVQNLVHVVEPMPAVLVAFANHSAAERAAFRRFMDAEGPKVCARGNMNLKCTLREVLMLKRVLEAASVAKDQLPRAERARLLGNLNPKVWKVAILTPTEPPAPPERLAIRELRKVQSCRHCSKSGVKLSRCKVCNSVDYCSRECQVADWKDRHKKECKAIGLGGAMSATAEAGAAGTPPTGGAGGGSRSGGAATVQKDGDVTILVDIVGCGDDAGPGMSTLLMSTTGHSFDLSALPKNRHGDSEFVVKAQNAFDPDFPIQIYDEAKSFTILLSRAKLPAEHAALMAALRSTPPPPGSLGPSDPRRKTYLYARRVGPSLRIVIEGRRPPQQQRW